MKPKVRSSKWSLRFLYFSSPSGREVFPTVASSKYAKANSQQTQNLLNLIRHKRPDNAQSLPYNPVSLVPSSIPIHPRQPIRRLLPRKHLPGILLQPSISLPETQRLLGCLQIRSKIRCVVFSKQSLDAVELLTVAVRDGDFDLDGALDVADGTANAAGECGAGLARCEEFEGECDSGSIVLSAKESQDRAGLERVVIPVTGPLARTVFEDLEDGWANIVFGV